MLKNGGTNHLWQCCGYIYPFSQLVTHWSRHCVAWRTEVPNVSQGPLESRPPQQKSALHVALDVWIGWLIAARLPLISGRIGRQDNVRRLWRQIFGRALRRRPVPILGRAQRILFLHDSLFPTHVNFLLKVSITYRFWRRILLLGDVEDLFEMRLFLFGPPRASFRFLFLLFFSVERISKSQKGTTRSKFAFKLRLM